MVAGIIIAADNFVPQRAVAAPGYAIVRGQLSRPLSLVEEQGLGEDRGVVILGGMVGVVAGPGVGGGGGSATCGGGWTGCGLTRGSLSYIIKDVG